ncbi:MAG: N-acetyl-gamma-glutamyl-phosphate reductase, partial [Phycisphaerales bacterium]
MNPVRVSIVGGSGYTGGELMRLLLAHPNTEIAQVTSRKLKGLPVFRSHPNLRGHVDVSF